MKCLFVYNFLSTNRKKSIQMYKPICLSLKWVLMFPQNRSLDPLQLYKSMRSKTNCSDFRCCWNHQSIFVRLGNSVSRKIQKKCGPWMRKGPLCTHMWFTDLPVANSNLYKWHGVVVRSYGLYVKSWLFLFETDAWAWCTPSFLIQLQYLICFIYYDGMRFLWS